MGRNKNHVFKDFYFYLNKWIYCIYNQYKFLFIVITLLNVYTTLKANRFSTKELHKDLYIIFPIKALRLICSVSTPFRPQKMDEPSNAG